MVLDLGFLGDTVHLLPALWMVRQAYPQAELHAAVADHIISLMACLPWVDRAWGYPRFPKHATLRENLQMVARLRKERFDVVINLNGSDRSSWLTFLSGAPARLGRRPKDGGPPFWGRMFTEFVQYNSTTEPVYVQKCRCLEQAGFPFTQAEFHAQVDPAHLEAAGITTADAGTYFHLSPFTTADKKELPPEQLAELISVLESRFPEKRWVLSGAPTERERRKMEALVAGLQAQALAGVCRRAEFGAVGGGDSAQRRASVRRHGDTSPGFDDWRPLGIVVSIRRRDERVDSHGEQAPNRAGRRGGGRELLARG